MTEGKDEPARTGTTRRTVLLGAGAVGAAGLLAACGGGPSSPGSAPPDATTPATQGPIHTTDIPVGGGMIFPQLVAVVTQPSAGTFKAFDATCKHMGCLVGSVSNGQIVCPCHGSRYRITDGSVVNGPATAPLDPKHATVSGDIITVS